MGLLGNPHKRLKFIHVAGTKGKGSTSYLIASMLARENYSVGLFTSPHLISMRERIRILKGDREHLVGFKELSELINNIKPHVIETRKYIGIPTYFEVLTVLAILYFYQKKTDFVVLEVGMGGRLDATNVIAPLVSVITPISLDHTEILGNAIEKIAKEKAGIIKYGIPCISAIQKKNVAKIIKDKCKKLNSSYYTVGNSMKINNIEFKNYKSYFDLNVFGNFYPKLNLSLLGKHQIENATLAIGSVEILKKYGIRISKETVYSALAHANWHGRLQILKKKPFLIVDGAHNVASARTLLNSIKMLFRYRRLFLILGMCKDKDIKNFIEIFYPYTYKLIFTKFNSSRSASLNYMMKTVNHLDKNKMVCSPNIKESLKIAMKEGNKNDLICVTGSFYLVAEALSTIGDISL